MRLNVRKRLYYFLLVANFKSHNPSNNVNKSLRLTNDQFYYWQRESGILRVSATFFPKLRGSEEEKGGREGGLISQPKGVVTPR